MQETGVQSLGQKDSLEKGIATHASILAWRIPWIEESVLPEISNSLDFSVNIYVFLDRLFVTQLSLSSSVGSSVTPSIRTMLKKRENLPEEPFFLAQRCICVHMRVLSHFSHV